MPNKLVAEMPWEVHASVHGNSASVRGARGEEIAMNIYAPHAELIVRAMNCHKELLEALEAALVGHQIECDCGRRNLSCLRWVDDARSAIAKANGLVAGPGNDLCDDCGMQRGPDHESICGRS